MSASPPPLSPRHAATSSTLASPLRSRYTAPSKTPTPPSPSPRRATLHTSTALFQRPSMNASSRCSTSSMATPLGPHLALAPWWFAAFITGGLRGSSDEVPRWFAASRAESSRFSMIASSRSIGRYFSLRVLLLQLLICRKIKTLASLDGKQLVYGGSSGSFAHGHNRRGQRKVRCSSPRTASASFPRCPTPR